MFSFKRFVILILTAVILTAGVSAQMTVEQSYLRETMEIMIIRETARSQTREQKMIALEYIGNALDRGSTNDEIRQTLEYLANEGRRSVARENNRIVNNYPEIRRQAVKYLGQIGNEEARKSLIVILQSENEPAVLQETIKALGDIGTNENNETAANIAWIMDRNNNLNPDNLMALATIDAFEKIAKRNNGLNSPEAVQTLIRISSDTRFITPVRERARQVVADLRSYGR